MTFEVRSWFDKLTANGRQAHGERATGSPRTGIVSASPRGIDKAQT